MDKKYQVFVSSTYEDLQEERRKVMEALLQMNCFPVGMEYFNASDESQWDVIKSLIDECDYYVLILAGRYGSIEESTGKSYTQKEYEYALSKGVPAIAFIHKDIASLPKAKTETDPSIEVKLASFQCDVKKHLCKFWETSDNLASQVVLSLNNLIKTKPRTGWVRADQISGESSKEILRLKEQIESLNNTIKEIEEEGPAGSDGLVQGEDTFELLFSSSYFGDDSINLSWNRIIAAVAPHMIDECPESELRVAIKDMVKLIDDSVVDGKSLVDECFQTIKIQLIALGIMKISPKKHSPSDTSTYWTLTPYGSRLMMTLKAIRR